MRTGTQFSYSISTPRYNITVAPYNEKQVMDTLIVLTKILNDNEIEYRLLGSIVTCALRNEVYRKINDLDLLVDKNKQEVLEKELLKIGFKKTVKNHLRVSEQLNLNIYQHPTLLETSFYGLEFCENGSATLTMPAIKATVDKEAILPTKYTLQNIEFIGIPAGVVLKTIMYSKSNPKRQKEFEIMNKLKIQPHQGNIYKVELFGMDISGFPRLVNYILEIIGVFRNRIGKSYDIWK